MSEIESMEKKVEFKIGKETLRGSLFIPKGKGPFSAVIFLNGSGGAGERQFKAAQSLSRNGILGFAFNYRGSGVSDGKFEDQTIEMGVEDARAAFAFLKSLKEVDKERIGICGGSFGGFIAGLLSFELNPKSIILSAPAAYPPDLLNLQRDSDKELRENFLNSKSYSNIAKFKGALLIVKCEFDGVIPGEMVETYLDKATLANQKEFYLLKGAKHRIIGNPEEVFEQKIIEWFTKHFNGKV